MFFYVFQKFFGYSINFIIPVNTLPMKKLILSLLAIIAIIATIAVATKSTAAAQNDYLRIHVRANSNSQTDQDVKYKVKDEVVKFITPYAAKCKDKQTAMEIISDICPDIEKVCNATLKRYGFDYASKAQVRAEKFPTRVYGDLTLEEDIYDALIIELGEGSGDNWWCVIYPPLCFTSGSGDIEYRSAIYDIIRKFFK